MLPRLQAEESLRAAQIAAVAAGTCGKEERRRILREWHRMAYGHERRDTRRTLSPLGLAAIGIHYVEVPPRNETPS